MRVLPGPDDSDPAPKTSSWPGREVPPQRKQAPQARGWEPEF